MGELALKMWRSCLRKKAYRSKRTAEKVAADIKEKRGVTLYVYECPLCGKWHLTKKERGVYASKGNQKQ